MALRLASNTAMGYFLKVDSITDWVLIISVDDKDWAVALIGASCHSTGKAVMKGASNSITTPCMVVSMIAPLAPEESQINRMKFRMILFID